MLARALRVPALRKRLLLTVLAVVLFRLGQNLPLPGLRADALEAPGVDAGGGGGGGGEAAGGDPRLYGLVELLTGDGLGELSVLTFGILPALAARLVADLAGPLIPRVRLLAASGEDGAAVLARRTRWLAVLLAAVLGVVVTTGVYGDGCVPLTGLCAPGESGLVQERADGPLGALTLVACMTAGAAVVLWLSGLITARGIGEGLSVLLVAQLAAVVPGQVADAARETGGARAALVVLAVVLALVVMTVLAVLVGQAERRIPLQRAKRMIGRHPLGPAPTYVPVRGGQGGFGMMIPASLLLLVPAPAGPWLLPGYVLLVLGHAWLRAGTEPDAVEVAQRLKRSGMFVPGIPMGRQTAQYLAYVRSRIGLAAALCMTVVALLPVAALMVLDGPAERFALSATTLLIVASAAVGTALPAARQLESLGAQHAYGPILR
ncbi:preprotein translocase subunit SecY [Streptomyces venezuelae]|uniref:preprotein translocase subunit SecY n=1 Tax=Streptomyces venezuelae TaxID=54571 RepID=UPI00123D20C2|nr:preprotein translocase subunit SecY [Streptomyces venezuelae]QES16826.1 preprotein translocase subunit SecY [Streptomyces venezuelae]